MSERRKDLTPDFGDYDLSAVLDEYRKAVARRPKAPEAETPAPEPERPAAAAEPVPEAPKAPEAAVSPPETPRTEDPQMSAAPQESIAERSRRIVMEALGETLRQYQQQHAEAVPAESEPQGGEPPVAVSAAAEAPSGEKTPPEDKPAAQEPEATPSEAAPEEAQDEPAPKPRRKRRPAPEPEPEEPADGEEEYDDDGQPALERVSFSERFLAPAVRMVATWIARRQMQKAEAANWPDPVDIRETRELTAAKAAKYYASLAKTLVLRCRIAVFLCVILCWIALGMPMMGMLRVSLPLEAGVSVLLTLAVMIAALDVVTAGLRQLADLRPGAEALASLSAILACVDGVLVLFGRGDNLPFCAIGGVALTFALWGERLTCTALRRTFRTAASSKEPTILTSEVLSDRGDTGLLRTDRGTTEGIVRRSESQDMCRSAYAAAAPFLMLGALVLSIAASIGGQGSHFLHTLSALLSVSASFAAFISFPLPYSLASRHLRNTGAALAGFQGCADIGRTRRIVISDEDLFPPGTMKFSEINVQEGVFLGKAVSSTAALICAAGSGVSSLFRELVERRGYHIPPLDQFALHEGGGLSGIVGGERVLVGSAGFMNLMGIRLPQNLKSKNAICTAIGGELVAVFVIEYIPVTSVQEALVTLMRGRTQTIFAIRDFNITPLMIRQLFRMPTDNFNFPSFRERYQIGGGTVSDAAPVNAVITRGGMLPMVEAAEAGRKLYATCRTGTILSLIGTVIGMIILFLLCRAGSFDTASVGNVLSFLILWALPVVILSFGQNRH